MYGKVYKVRVKMLGAYDVDGFLGKVKCTAN